MAEKTDLIEAARAIARALRSYAGEEDLNKIHVFESSPGILRAIVGSKKFRKMGITERQDEIWKFLRESVEQVHLGRCYGVHTLDPEEYEAEFFPQSSSSSASPYIYGQELVGGGDE